MPSRAYFFRREEGLLELLKERLPRGGRVPRFGTGQYWRIENLKSFMPREEFAREVERELTGRESEPSELIYFKVYKSQAPVIERAIDTAALMLGSDKSRGYCLEMICADFLAGAQLENGNPKVLLFSLLRLFGFLPAVQKQEFLRQVTEAA